MASGDEFAEFETDEATFDAMLASAEPVRIVTRGPRRVMKQVWCSICKSWHDYNSCPGG